MESVGLTMFSNVYAGRRVLVTGHTGFKGSWLCLWLQGLGADVSGLSLDPDTTPSHWSLLALDEIADWRMDLRDATRVREVLDDVQPEIIFHLAAQPLVRRSYREPLTTFDTNVIGLVHLLEGVRQTPSVRVLVNATTDKVYAEQERPAGYAESDPLGGHDPYSTSKACAELVSECYRKSFFQTGVRISTARAGNVIGGGDWADERLVPDIVRALTSGQSLHVRNPNAVRPWQHVLEPLAGYLRIGQKLWEDGQSSEGAWNLGPHGLANLPVSQIIELSHSVWPGFEVEAVPGEHPHEAQVLQLDSTRAANELGWRSVWDARQTIERTMRWYRAYYENGTVSSADDLAAYADDAKTGELPWAT
jgi:CDP-glucose 4,6-dehydratase